MTTTSDPMHPAADVVAGGTIDLTADPGPRDAAPAPRADVDAPPARPAKAAIPHRPLIDGLRGALVAIIIAYHLDGALAPKGGWVAVTAFFVLSGFLITTLLLSEHGSTGTVSLTRFYARRARRLAPALLVALGGIAVTARALGGADVWAGLRGDFLASLFYVANWRFIATDQSYFASFEPSPFRHMWSLAIEEQFYLVWPLALMAILAVVGRRRVGLVVAAGALASGWWMRTLVLGGADLSRAYYGTDTRAGEFLVGCFLAVVCARSGGPSRWVGGGDDDDPEARARLRRRATAIGVAGLVGFSVLLLFLSFRVPSTYTRFGMLLGATMSALVVYGCAHTDGGILGRLFGNTPMRALGIRSYTLYLVHWPVIVFLAPPRVHWDPMLLDIARVALALVITEVVHRAVERPIHKGTWAMPRPGMALLVCVVVVTGVGIAATAPLGTERDPAARALEQAPAVVAPPTAAAGSDTGPAPSSTVVDDAGSADDTDAQAAPVPFGNRITVLGDSEAFILLESVPDDLGLLVGGTHHAACDITGDRIFIGDTFQESESACAAWPDLWDQALTPETDTVVVTLGLRQLFDQEVDGERAVVGSPAWEEAYRADIAHAMDIIRARTDVPVVWMDVPCFRWAPGPDAGEVSDPDRLRAVNEVLADELSTFKGVTVLPYRERVCSGPEHAQTVDSLRPDGAHLDPAAADDTWRWLVEEIREAQGAD